MTAETRLYVIIAHDEHLCREQICSLCSIYSILVFRS